jgi:hypothetical protein
MEPQMQQPSVFVGPTIGIRKISESQNEKSHYQSEVMRMGTNMGPANFRFKNDAKYTSSQASTGSGFREPPIAGTSTSSFDDPQRNGVFSRDYESDIPSQIDIHYNKQQRKEKTSQSMMRARKQVQKRPGGSTLDEDQITNVLTEQKEISINEYQQPSGSQQPM